MLVLVRQIGVVHAAVAQAASVQDIANWPEMDDATPAANATPAMAATPVGTAITANALPVVAATPVATAITAKLAAFAPHHLEVLNESHNHNVPPNAETHFKVVIVSAQFSGTPLLQRHRAVNDALADELAGPVHALSIVAKTPEQWSKSQAVPESPECMGGARR